MVYCCFLLFFFVYSSHMSATTCWNHWLRRKYFAEWSYYCYIYSFHTRPLLAWFCSVTFSSNLILVQWRHITAAMVYCCFWLIYLLPPRIWVWPLVGITDYIGITFLSNHIIAIHHYFIHNTYWIYFTVSDYLAILFQRNGDISLSPWFFKYFEVTLFSVIFQRYGEINLPLSLLLLIK